MQETSGEHSSSEESRLQASSTINHENERDHLFISYASEDGILAEWLTLRLTAEGFRVWCDRTKLLGGESYPVDIDYAIKTSTFRVLALLSRHSIRKPNPLKERTLALNISKQRANNFLIPLNIDGLSATELDWMTGDLTFIPFYKSWAEGLSQLLRKLLQIHAPRIAVQGRESVARWATVQDNLVQKEERLWSNILPILEVPSIIRRYYAANKEDLQYARNTWPFYRQDDHVVWSFGPPSNNVPVFERQKVNWSKYETVDNIRTTDIVQFLLSRNLFLYCQNKGMKVSGDGEDIYFPDNMLKNNRLTFERYDGRTVYVKVVGERTFRFADSQTERSAYHLAPYFVPLMKRFGNPCYQINLRVIWTNLGGKELLRGTSHRRRRSLAKYWWNYQWLSRIMAFVSWVTNGQRTCDILVTENGKITISGVPIAVRSPVSIDEERLSPAGEEAEDESTILDEDMNGEEEDRIDLGGT